MADEEVKDSNTLDIEDDAAVSMLEKITGMYVLPHYAEEFNSRMTEISVVEVSPEKVAMLKNLLADMVFNYHVNEALRMFVEAKEAGLVDEAGKPLVKG